MTSLIYDREKALRENWDDIMTMKRPATINSHTTEIDRAERKAMDTLSEWVNAMHPKFNAVEMQDLKRRLTAAFREYEMQAIEDEGDLDRVWITSYDGPRCGCGTKTYKKPKWGLDDESVGWREYVLVKKHPVKRSKV